MKHIGRSLLIALTTVFNLSAATTASAGDAAQSPPIEGFRDSRIKCYCNSDKHGKYWLDAKDIENAYKQDHSSPSIMAEAHNIYLLELPEGFKDASKAYAKKCKPEVATSKPRCWVKASAVETSQDPKMIRSTLAIRQRDCGEQGTQMGSESCVKK